MRAGAHPQFPVYNGHATVPTETSDVQQEPGSNHFRPVDEQLALLMRGVDCGDPQTRDNMENELRERLAGSRESGRPLRVYCGFDPSRSDLHLGHTIPMRKLRQFQELGHEVVFLIGSFTGTIGDPSDKDSARAQQTLAEALDKAETFATQAFRILDRDATIVDYNHRWLEKLTFGDVVEIASLFTVQQFLARHNFRQRQERGDAIWLHEFFYALMQAQDAVALETDVQIGGTDQLFNLMAGRKLMEARGMRPQTVLTYPILPGTDGVLRMSKSSGNTINIDDEPGLMFTRVLNLPDDAVPLYCNLATRWDQATLEAAEQRGKADIASLKRDLAKEIVSTFHGDDLAEQAAADAARMHSGDAPSSAPVVDVSSPVSILDLLAGASLVKSRGEGRRLVAQGGVRLDGETVSDPLLEVHAQPGQEQILQAGKTRFLRLVRPVANEPAAS